MKFTDKFTFTTITVVLVCISLVLVGGLISLRALALKYHQQRMSSIITVIERQIEKDTSKDQFDAWLPDLLEASGIVRLQIKRDDKVFFQNYYENRQVSPNQYLLDYEFKLKSVPNTYLILQTKQPAADIRISFVPLLGIGSAVLICLILLWFAIHWIKKQFRGAELLERRSKYLLQNNPTARNAQPGEWPKLASKALEQLSRQLELSRKERSYFDEYIRGQAFLDEKTGMGNRLAFDNRLDTLALDKNILSSALLLIQFSELDEIEHQCGPVYRDKTLAQITDILKIFSVSYGDYFKGRISQSQFIVMIPQVSFQETIVIAKKLTKLLYQLQLPDSFRVDDFFHIGVVNFYYAEKPLSIMDDLSSALLVAVQQKNSGWFMADDKNTSNSLEKGTTRWRTLLETVLAKDAILLDQQSVMLRDGKEVLYYEFWPRIKDKDGKIIRAGTFLPMAEKCGLDKKFDRKMLHKILKLLKEGGDSQTAIAINLCVPILLDTDNHNWLIFELMEMPKSIRQKLVIEVSEHLLKDNYSALCIALNALQKLGCKIAIDNVGKFIVNTKYVVDFNVDYLKLHTGLVRDIFSRKTNQVALQSLTASCINRKTEIIAVGVENIEEWECLLKLGIYAGQGDYFQKQSFEKQNK
jgi:RNase E specificity factor CsrD